MINIWNKSKTVILALVLLFLSQVPLYYVEYENERQNLFGVANKITVNFILIGLLIILIDIMLGIKNGFYKNAKRTLEWKNIILILILIIPSVALDILFSQFIQFHHLGRMDNQIAIDSVMGSLLWFGKILGVALLAPILEESIFRASIYKIFSNNKIAFVFSSLLFTFMHSGYSWVFLIYLPMSLAVTFIYHRRRILTDSIVFHSFFNLLITFVNFLMVN
ncbi:CPBP family intramembrane glutamic endopeptidase [Lactococcus lactis]|uniref:CPBP family intramembrane glutamic endopeptidase n=1 Tax=Lactococcus lactis TaxID=1358 RepID=UPI0019114A0D|nr:type II CAAX endopeptidase family protein [Lactococcus lactis]WDA68772.1 type II CAAX endopeptidase family protein [Lactococcus lactis]